MITARPGDRISVEVQLVDSPDGKRRVLLQLPDGFVLMSADVARAVAAALVRAAEELDR